MSSGTINGGYDDDHHNSPTQEDTVVDPMPSPKLGIGVMGNSPSLGASSVDEESSIDPLDRRKSSVKQSPLIRRIHDRLRASGTSQRSFKHYLTKEALPHADNYRHRLSFPTGSPSHERPTLDELLDKDAKRRASSIKGWRLKKVTTTDSATEADKAEGVVKFGWIGGVYIPCLLNIWGVMLFLRLTWVVGQAGLIEGLILITLANAVTFITALSMSAVATNGQVKAGGVYFMISRSLGPEFGGAVGMTFTLANAIAVSMYVIGFCESLLDALLHFDVGGVFNSRLNNVRLIGAVTLTVVLAIAVVGMSLVNKVQNVLLLLLVASQIDFLVGSVMPPKDWQRARGVVGFNLTVLEQNLWSDYREDEGRQMNFFGVFAVFFPAVTGIVAGANISGDLHDPSSAIPKGTLLAILTTFVSYLLYACIIASSTIRFASGDISEVVNNSFADCNPDRECLFGSIPSQQTMQTMSLWGPLVSAGCFAATLSSAMASLVGAPRVFMAVAKDKLFPGIECFGKGCGSNNEPMRGYLLVFAVSLGCVLVGDLNQVSSLLSNFFVATYAVINYAVFHAGITRSPGWRPSFRCHNQWVSLLGSVLCIAVMVLMDPKTALATLVVLLVLYVWVRSRAPRVNWGSSSQSQSFVSALKAVQTLARVEDHVKNYRPKVIVLCGSPPDRPLLVDFANLLTKRISLLELVHVVGEDTDVKMIRAAKEEVNRWLRESKVKAFYSVTRNHSYVEGVRAAIELSGLGKLSPNMLLAGFAEHWWLEPDQADEYYKALQVAFNMHLAVGVLRVKGGLDLSDVAGAREQVMRTSRQVSEASEASQSTRNNSMVDVVAAAETAFSTNPIDEHVVRRMTQFRDKTHKEGVIDVYWLFDDGGLTLLLPHILTTRAKFAKCRLRVFFLSNNCNDVQAETKSMAALLNKFRIEFQDVILLADATKRPSKQTRDDFHRLTANLPGAQPRCSNATMTRRLSKTRNLSAIPSLESEASGDGGGGYRYHYQPRGSMVSETDLARHLDRTLFHLRIAEIARENSQNSALVVMTLPLPEKDLPHALYLAWLDFLSRKMPPFLLVRGNQESVLTYYS